MGWLTGLQYGFVDLGCCSPSNRYVLGTRPWYGLFNPTNSCPGIISFASSDKLYVFIFGLLFLFNILNTVRVCAMVNQKFQLTWLYLNSLEI